MNVNSVTNAQSRTTDTMLNTPQPTVDYNAFLQLLIAQMKNQDPTSPTDMSQYMSQFAQMSSVERGAIQTNAKLDTLLSSTALSQAESLIGRTASFTSSDGQSTTGTITAVRIIQGGAVATLENGTQVQLGPGITIS